MAELERKSIESELKEDDFEAEIEKLADFDELNKLSDEIDEISNDIDNLMDLLEDEEDKQELSFDEDFAALDKFEREMDEVLEEGERLFALYELDQKYGKTFYDLETMKTEMGKTYGEIKENKPPNSPNIAKWMEKGGSVRVCEAEGESLWSYCDSEGREVDYINGYPLFPPSAKHPIIEDISIGHFTGDRYEDKMLYLEKLQEEFGITDIPLGYALHHDAKDGRMQLIKLDWHKEFTHYGGHSLYASGDKNLDRFPEEES